MSLFQQYLDMVPEHLIMVGDDMGGKPRVSYQEVKEALAEGYTSPLNHDRKRQGHIETKPDRQCEACNGTGTYTNSKYSRTCIRCHGKGAFSLKDSVRYNSYLAFKDRGKAFTFQRHESIHGESNWHRI